MGEDIEKVRMVIDAGLYAEGLAIEVKDGMLPTAKGLVEAELYWDSLTGKQKIFVMWIMQMHFKHLVGE
ncbi:hypothetical protein LCGC14_1128110 [marine sediment metagenome]|uniref:Uncharacterized protein n=1 Tax=marine sediment metagenome TaxID=412755 RepID=A0A0F9MPR4_9ZZZZ